MERKNSTEVIIAGKPYTLSGSESEGYLKRVASYLNGKLNDCENTNGYKKQNSETKTVLLALNIADDYIKLKDKLHELEHIIEEKDKALYNLKHELISSQIQLDNSEEVIDQLKDDQHEFQKRILQLENEIENMKKK